MLEAGTRSPQVLFLTTFAVGDEAVGSKLGCPHPEVQSFTAHVVKDWDEPNDFRLLWQDSNCFGRHASFACERDDPDEAAAFDTSLNRTLEDASPAVIVVAQCANRYWLVHGRAMRHAHHDVIDVSHKMGGIPALFFTNWLGKGKHKLILFSPHPCVANAQFVYPRDSEAWHSGAGTHRHQAQLPLQPEPSILQAACSRKEIPSIGAPEARLRRFCRVAHSQ